MFTGIIEAVGRVVSLRSAGEDLILSLASGGLDLSDVGTGDSIAVNGVCLTVTGLEAGGFRADVSRETLRRSRLAEWVPGDRVNLEKALSPDGRLGGHLVSGHVDGVGTIRERSRDGRATRLRIRPPDDLGRYIAARGSICVDGVSLTVNDLEGRDFWLNVVPHTLRETIMESYCVGGRVHLEVDIIARYLEQLMRTEPSSPPETGLDIPFLRRHGFMP